MHASAQVVFVGSVEEADVVLHRKARLGEKQFAYDAVGAWTAALVDLMHFMHLPALRCTLGAASGCRSRCTRPPSDSMPTSDAIH